MLSNFFSDKTKEHWNLYDFEQTVVEGTVGPNFKGVEKFFRGWRAVIMTFLAFSVVGASIDDLTRGASVEEFIGSIIIFFSFYLIYYKLWIEEQKYLHFVIWVERNKHKLLNGEMLVYEHSQVSLQTNLAHFEACFSIIFLTVQMQSRFLFEEKDRRLFTGFFYTLFTFIFGWWGIPWGPIYTIKIIGSNIFGGRLMTVEELLEKIKKDKI